MIGYSSHYTISLGPNRPGGLPGGGPPRLIERGVGVHVAVLTTFFCRVSPGSGKEPIEWTCL